MFICRFNAIAMITLSLYLSGVSSAVLPQVNHSHTGVQDFSKNPYLSQITQRMDKLQHKADKEVLAIRVLQSKIEQVEIKIAALQLRFHKEKINTPELPKQSIANLTGKLLEFIAMPGLLPLSGMVLATIILFFIFRNYLKRRKRLVKPNHQVSTEPVVNDMQDGKGTNYDDTLQLLQDNNVKSVDLPNKPNQENNELIVNAKQLVTEGASHQAIHLLETQLATDSDATQIWKSLFEILQSQGMKTEFRKLARRFKRLDQHHDLWAYIQQLGHQLESDNPLYFDEKERKTTFFPEE